MVEDIYRERQEPVPIEMPEGEFDKPGVQILKDPLPELRSYVPPRTPLPIEEQRDWSHSSLYKFISVAHLRELVDQGKVSLMKGEQRPPTPTEIVNVMNTT